MATLSLEVDSIGLYILDNSEGGLQQSLFFRHTVRAAVPHYLLMAVINHTELNIQKHSHLFPASDISWLLNIKADNLGAAFK